MNDIKSLSGGNLSIGFKLIYQYQHKDPRLMAIYKTVYYKKKSFFGVRNINCNIIACEDNIFMP